MALFFARARCQYGRASIFAIEEIMRIVKIVPLILTAMLPAWGQIVFFPSAAGSRLYFPQLADGGPAAQKWATTLLLVNTSTMTAGTVNVSFYDDNGQPLALDFGGGAQATLEVNLPAGGTRTVTSSGGSDTMKVGWAVATSSLPVTGTVLYEARQNGAPLWDVAAAGARPTYTYSSYANANLGVALVNPSSTKTIYLQVTATDKDGHIAGTAARDLPPLGHLAFGLGGAVSGMTGSFEGTISISSRNATPAAFVAWTLNARDGLLSPLPSGELQSPAPRDQIVADIVGRMRVGGAAAIQDMTSLLGAPLATQMAAAVQTMPYSIDTSSTVSASYNTADGKVHISSSMIEMVGDSRAAIAFLFGHMATRGVQQQVGIPDSLLQMLGGAPLLADTVGMIAAGKGGFDPLGAMDFFWRMEWASNAGATIDAGTKTEFGLSDVMGRLDSLQQVVILGCGLSQPLTADCTAMHSTWYPDVPVSRFW